MTEATNQPEPNQKSDATTDRSARGTNASPARRPFFPRNSCVFNVVASAVIIIIVFFIVCAFWFIYDQNRGYGRRSKEAEVKQNLHAIQLAIERYAVDCVGSYPAFLTGGQRRHSKAPDGRIDFPHYEGTEMVGKVDVLKIEGYLPSYPKNPFVLQDSDVLAVSEFQTNLPASIYGNDPLRNGTPESRLMGTRFGAQCNLMGNVLGDSRWGIINSEHTWADVDFGAWDIWETDKPKPFLPGQFFYRSEELAIFTEEDADANEDAHVPFRPTEIYQYILGAYGSPRTHGSDVLGCDSEGNGGYPWSWLHSGPNEWPKSKSIRSSNPNGIADAVIIVLTTPESYTADYRSEGT